MFSTFKKSLDGSFTPYPPEILPSGFRYPDKYLALSRGPGLPETLVWWFPDPNDESGQRGWRNRLHWQSQGWRYLDDIDPIPFARNEEWAAHFDGSDHSGAGTVLVSHTPLSALKNAWPLRCRFGAATCRTTGLP